MFSNISNTEVTAPNTTVVTTKVPWVAFPAFLWSTGRTAIAAPAQLNNAATCDTNMIGTGPFKLKSFDPTTGHVSVTKNPNYWQKGFPYLDGIDFIPQAESSQRVSGLQGGQFDMIQDSGGKDLDAVKAISGTNTVEEPNGRMEISHTLPNVSVAPFNDLNARKAIAMAINPETVNEIVNKGNWAHHQPGLRHRRHGLREGLRLPDVQPDGSQEAGHAVQEQPRRQVRVRPAVDVRPDDPGTRPPR